MYKQFTLSKPEIQMVMEILPIVAPNLSKQKLNYTTFNGYYVFLSEDRNYIIPVIEFLFDIIIHKYVTNILFKNTLSDYKAQNNAINSFVSKLIPLNVNGTHLMKFAISYIHKQLMAPKA